MMAALLRNNKIMRATHNMLAYRIAVLGKRGMLQDYDDDGETAAGSRMLHLLQVRWWLIACRLESNAVLNCCARELVAAAATISCTPPPLPFSRLLRAEVTANGLRCRWQM